MNSQKVSEIPTISCGRHMGCGRLISGVVSIPSRSTLQRFCRLATECRDPMGQLLGERFLADTKYLAVNPASARCRIEHVLSESGGFDRWRLITWFQIDHWSGSRAFLARILWLQGFP